MVKKKPPINLSELNEEFGEEEEERGRPGELSYVDPRKRNGGSVSSGSYEGRDWKGLVGSLIIAVFLAGVLILFLTPSKASIKTLDDNVREVAGRVEEVSTKVDKSLTDALNKADTAITEARSAKNALDGYVRTDVLASYATKDQLSSVASPDLSAYVKASDLGALAARISELESDVSELGSSGSSSSGSSGSSSGPSIGFSVTPRWSSGFVYSANMTSVEVPIALKVENNTEANASNVEVQMVAQSRGVPIPLTAATVTGGWPLLWEKVYLANGVLVLQGHTPEWGGGLDIGSGEDETLYLTLKLTVKVAPADAVTFWVEGKVTEWN